MNRTNKIINKIEKIIIKKKKTRKILTLTK